MKNFLKRNLFLTVVSGLFLLLIGQATLAQAFILGEANDFAILGLNDGSVIINSATSITGNVGYSDGVTSTTNQKVDSFTGTAYVHSGATFNYKPATYAPSGGILTGAAVDLKLNQANIDAINANIYYGGLASTQSFGTLLDGDSQVINSTDALNVISINSIDFNSDFFQLNSRPGFTDSFVFNIAGDFDFSKSDIILNGLTSNNVLFNFVNASNIKINKAETTFYGTILAPLSDIEYHNPATFEGAIIGKNINLHSDFNLSYTPENPPGGGVVPEPASLILMGSGLVGFCLRRKLSK